MIQQTHAINFLFSILSVAYIAGIFLFADSSLVSDVATFNPYSLLHIPLYGILTILLICSKLPFGVSKLTNQRSQINLKNQIDQINQSNELNKLNKSNLLIAGLIAFIVAIADEIHQAYIPGRDASITDVFLDVIGIVLVLIVIQQIKKKKVIGLLGN